MPRPKKSRADALRAGAAREAAKAAALAEAVKRAAAQEHEESSLDDGAAEIEVDKENMAPSSEAASNKNITSPPSKAAKATQSRLAQEEAAASRALESLRNANSNNKVASTPLQRSRFTRSRGGAPSTLQVQRSQESTDVTAPPTNTRARNVPMAPMSVRKPMSTPRAEASMLALANFRRRGRAPSILGIGNDDDDTASLSSDGSFGDLMPDDESTPLPKVQAQKQLDSQLAAALGRTPEGAAADDNLPPRTSSSRKRKRSSEEIQVPFSQPTTTTDAANTRRSRGRTDVIDISSREEESSDDASLPQLPREETPATPSVSDSIMAPPASSSPVKVDTFNDLYDATPPPPKGRTTKAAGGPGIAKSWSRANKAKKAVKPLDTVALTGLLPKRRQVAAKGQFDVYSSDHSPEAGSDADELSFAPSKRRRRAGGSSSSKKQSTKAKAPGERSAPVRNTRNNTRSARARKDGDAGRASRTYSRRSIDKENDHSGSESSSSNGEGGDEADVSFEASAMSEVRADPPKELRDAKEKFAEVDQWSMDFEDVVPTSSSMADAR